MSTTALGEGPQRRAAGAGGGVDLARRTVASALPSTAAPPRTLLDVFSATVLRCGERTAIDAPDATLSYRGLADAAAGLAARLQEGGVGPGDRVGVHVPSGTAELYAAILGVLHAGAAYVPVDAEDPPARAADLWQRAGACALVREGLEISPLAPPRGSGRPLIPSDDAWVIFTSGSSGTPKGVAVSHRSAAAFVDAEAKLWGIDVEDRVLAGLSVGFDASCEEMWLAWGHGAALVPAPRALVRAGSELGDWIADREVTVVSSVPSLAAMWEPASLAGVRLLILGGEAAPERLSWRLAEERELWNTYGPTEATVVTTATRIRPEEPITIGWPLAGWETAVLDPRGEPVAVGEEGELVIGGVGLGRYLDPELDAERFAPVPALGWERAYRTGDMVRETVHGLEFAGRRDDQVKIAGRRIELGELDAHLNALPGVKAAAAAVRESATGNRVLVGYLMGDLDLVQARAALAARLPSGLVPTVVLMDELPRGTSGKIDRNALPWPPPRPHGVQLQLEGTAAWLAERWIEQLGPVAVEADSDFFELGGASLAAAKLVSVLRERFPALAVADIYRYRRLGEQARRLEQFEDGEAAEVLEPPARPSSRFGLLQLGGVVVLMAFAAVPLVIGTLAYGNVSDLGTPHVGWIWLILAWLPLGSPPARTGTYVLASHALLRNLRPGRYSRYSWLACRLWFVERLAKVAHLERMGGTPWVDRYARLLRIDVGRGARLGTVPPVGPLLHIGSGATVEANVDLSGWWIEGPDLVVGEIWIGANARVGSRTLLQPGTTIGEGAEIEPGSVVFGPVPAGEHWGGAPAHHLGRAGASWPEQEPEPSRHPRFWRSMFALSMGFEAIIALLALVPAIALLGSIGAAAPTLHSSLAWLLLDCVVVVTVSTTAFAILVALTLRLVWKLVRPGLHSDEGAVAWALWFGEDLKTAAGEILFPLYASLFTAPWLRLMGLSVGRRAEVSTATGLNPLVSLGAYAQATDDIGFCAARARGGTLQIEPISVGERTFLGPGAVLRGGTRVGARSLLGVLTLSPRRPPAGTSWFGVPALELPRVADSVDPTRTIAPPRRLIAGRAAMDLVRIVGPNTIALLIGLGDLLALSWLARHLGLAAMIALAPLVMLASGLLATAVTVVLKWLVMGRYRAGEHPLWSFFVWRDELMNTVQEQLAGQGLLEYALGTPLMSIYMRAMGSRVGRGVWCDTMSVTEYDMVELGDGSAINREACLMTHLFHDRLLRIGPTRIGAGATLGPTSAVLPDTTVGAGASLGGHSVVLRGEQLPPGTRWHGAPVVAA